MTPSGGSLEINIDGNLDESLYSTNAYGPLIQNEPNNDILKLSTDVHNNRIYSNGGYNLFYLTSIKC